MNGDGFDDVLVAASYYDGGQPDEGRVWAYHGSALGLDTTAAWTGEGDPATEFAFPESAAFAGDVNGDGFDDVILGTAIAYYDGGQKEEGWRTYVFHGSAAGLATAPAWTAEANLDFVSFAISVASAGDVNGDGYDDVIVGVPFYYGGNYEEGIAYVYLGSATGLGTNPAWTAPESNVNFANLGYQVSSAGDVNADGFDDVLVGAAGLNQTFLFLGSTTGLANVAAWTGDEAWICSAAGDVNADGFDDVIVGDSISSVVGFQEGAAFVYLGTATGLETTAEYVVSAGQFTSFFANVIAGAGDVDADGYDDVLVGALSYDNGETNEGRAYLYAGTCADPNDSDGDDVGDLCDTCPGFDDRLDADVDGVADDCDLCPALYDPTQGDDDADGIGDACDSCPASSPDADMDGFCAAQDCDDDDPTAYPGAEELCDGLDNACQGYVFPSELDEDGDGELVCAGDCDDTNPALHTSATEVCNGLDDNCDGTLAPDELDADDDNHTVCEGDCDDFSARRSPELTDICGDGIDNDCDGDVDQTCGDDGTESTGCTCNGAGGAPGAPLLALALLMRIARRRGRLPRSSMALRMQGGP